MTAAQAEQTDATTEQRLSKVEDKYESLSWVTGFGDPLPADHVGADEFLMIAYEDEDSAAEAFDAYVEITTGRRPRVGQQITVLRSGQVVLFNRSGDGVTAVYAPLREGGGAAQAGRGQGGGLPRNVRGDRGCPAEHGARDRRS